MVVGVYNIVFSSKWFLGDVFGCVEIFIKINCYVEVVFFV